VTHASNLSNLSNISDVPDSSNSPDSPNPATAAAKPVTLTVNGRRHTLELDEQTPLVDVLRDQLKLKGTRFGCGENQCGACFVMLDGFAVASCDTPLWAVADKQITTIEGLGNPDAPHRLQQAFIAEQAAQCGYCSSGMLISAAALLERIPNPSEAEVREALQRNLCRCGAHNRIVRAVLRAAAT
jgi:nicotinate dehydrogenase subunit A